MKKTVLFLILMCNFLALFSQSNTEKEINKEEAQVYLKKARKQSTTGAVLAIVGSTFLSVAGLITLSELSDGSASQSNGTAVSILAISGGAMMVGSIPFFVMSGQNKRTARLLLSSSSIEIAPGIFFSKQTSIGVCVRINNK